MNELDNGNRGKPHAVGGRWGGKRRRRGWRSGPPGVGRVAQLIDWASAGGHRPAAPGRAAAHRASGRLRFRPAAPQPRGRWLAAVLAYGLGASSATKAPPGSGACCTAGTRRRDLHAVGRAGGGSASNECRSNRRGTNPTGRNPGHDPRPHPARSGSGNRPRPDEGCLGGVGPPRAPSARKRSRSSLGGRGGSQGKWGTIRRLLARRRGGAVKVTRSPLEDGVLDLCAKHGLPTSL